MAIRGRLSCDPPLLSVVTSHKSHHRAERIALNPIRPFALGTNVESLVKRGIHSTVPMERASDRELP